MKKSKSVICALIISIIVSFFIPLRSYALEYPADYKELLVEIRNAVENKGLFRSFPNNEQTRNMIEKSDMSQAAKDFFLSNSFIGTGLDLSMLCYSVRDLDHNGIPELLLSIPADQLCTVFTLQNGTPTIVQEFWPRSTGKMYGDYLYNFGSNGAGYQVYYYCSLKGNTFITVDGYKNIEGTLYDTNDNRISRAKANEIDAKYQKLETPQWHMLIPGMFTDVDYSGWYSEPVIWATKKGITNGTSEIEFSPDASCTRAQMVTFLWRAQGCPEPKLAKSSFTDVSADAYYYEAVLWALENHITTGTTANTFSPNAIVTRAQTVTFLWRTSNQPIISGNIAFTDLDKSAYYYNAVLWAVNASITNGTSDTSFSPDAPCTRAQIVTFLYRAFCPERFHLEVSNYFKNAARLQSALTMGKTDPWNLGGSSYKYNGFYVETLGGSFSMKNESNYDITLYGAKLGEGKDTFCEALSQNGWLPMGETQNKWTDFGTVIEGRAYYLELTEDSQGSIVRWYINNWPQGDYADFYSQFD